MPAYQATNYSIQMHAQANAPAGSEAFIGLNLEAIDGGQPSRAVAFLNFYPDTATVPDNSAETQGDTTVYSAGFHTRSFSDVLTVIRETAPVSFWFDEQTKESIVGAGPAAIGKDA
jgi:hypothetical protein